MNQFWASWSPDFICRGLLQENHNLKLDHRGQKSHPLTINILDRTTLFLFLNLNSNMMYQYEPHPGIKSHLNIWKVVKTWVVDTSYLWFIRVVFILSRWSHHLTLLLLFCSKFVGSNTFCAQRMLLLNLIPGFSVRNLLCSCTNIKLEQNITDWVPEALNTTK